MSGSSFSSLTLLPTDRGDQGFTRILEQLRSEAARLSKPDSENTTVTVHRLRVLIKRLRALLWFASSTSASSEMIRAKFRLRKAAHLLAAQRDLVVTRSILQMLSRETSNAGYRGILQISPSPSRSSKLDHKIKRSLEKAAALVFETIGQFKRTRKASSKWPSAAIRLSAAFSATRKSGTKALRDDDPTKFHDWRKKAKRLLYLLQMTEVNPSKCTTYTINSVNELQDKLGDYHDSVVVQSHLQTNPLYKNLPRLIKHSVKILEKRKRRLRREVKKIAQRFRPN